MLPVPGGRPAGPARRPAIRSRAKGAAGPRCRPPPGTLAISGVLLACCRRAHPGASRPDASIPWRERDIGLTPRPEQSAGGSGRTYRHRQRTRTARDPAPATPADEPAAAPGALLTIEEVIAELRVSRAAFYRWRRRGTGPAEVRLPGGGVRIRRSALQAWLCRLEQPQQEDTPA